MLYRLMCMSFGLKRAPKMFEPAMDFLLSKLKLEIVLAHSADTVIFPPNLGEHIDNLLPVLMFLYSANVALQLKIRVFY